MTGQEKNDRSRVSGWSPEAAARLKSAVKRYGSQGIVAEEAGISRPSLVEILSGRSTPTNGTLANICRVLDIQPAEILVGASDKVAALQELLGSEDVLSALQQRFPPNEYATAIERLLGRRASGADIAEIFAVNTQSLPSRSVADVENMAFVPLHDVVVSAGHGATAVEAGESAERLGFPNGWLRRQFGDPAKLRIVHVRGDSMAPTLGDGDLVMINVDRRDPVDGIFVLRLDDQLMVKRVLFPSARRVLVTSDNRDYDRFDRLIDLEREDGLHLVGRVVWAGKSI